MESSPVHRRESAVSWYTRIGFRLGSDYLSGLYVLFFDFADRADFVSLSFMWAFAVLNDSGSFGLIACNTISEGDTRRVALDTLVNRSCTIIRAIRSLPWPGTASQHVAVVWITKRAWRGDLVLDDTSVAKISTFLDDLVGDGTSYPLADNQPLSFEGAKPAARGNVLEPEEASSLITRNPCNKDVLIPYLRGEDLNSLPEQSPTKWVIDFKARTLEEAKAYPECFAIVLERVKPVRDNVNRKAHREKWWMHGELRPGMYAAINKLSYVIVHAFTSKYIAFSVIPKAMLFAAPMNVFAFNDWPRFAVLQSSVHITWAIKHVSSMGNTIRYTRTDVFDTFSLPQFPSATLFDIGEAYHSCRKALMVHSRDGLTATYNRFHDPDETSADIQKLRDLHVEMDRAVAAAYGWTGLDLGHGFHETKQGVRFTISEPARREVLARLLTLNHERYNDEVKQGLHGKKKAAPKKKAPKNSAKQEADLFDEGDDE